MLDLSSSPMAEARCASKSGQVERAMGTRDHCVPVHPEQNGKRIASNAGALSQVVAMAIAHNAFYPETMEVSMSIAGIVIGVFVLCGILTLLIGWVVAAYTHWLVVQPRRITDRKPRESLPWSVVAPATREASQVRQFPG